jgi:hypothetical protein
MAEHQSALPPARHEMQDVSFPYMAIGFFGTLVVLLFSVMLVMWIYPSAVVDRRLTGQLPRYPEPRLQSDPTADLRHFVAAELAELNSSGWVDRSKGIAHIPIDKAMQRIAQQGIPDWPTKGKAP